MTTTAAPAYLCLPSARPPRVLPIRRCHRPWRLTALLACTIRSAVLPTKGDDAEGGTGIIDRPGLDRTAVLERPRTEGGEGARAPGGTITGGGNFRLLLLDDPGHTEVNVVKAITRIVPGVTEEHARNCFNTATQLGMAIIMTCLKEHAEFYAQQLTRSGCRSSIEPDTTVLS